MYPLLPASASSYDKKVQENNYLTCVSTCDAGACPQRCDETMQRCMNSNGSAEECQAHGAICMSGCIVDKSGNIDYMPDDNDSGINNPAFAWRR